MSNPNDTPYDATRDPRTGRPTLPIDAENARKAEAESEPLRAEENQGIAFDDDDISTGGEEDDLPQEIGAEPDDSNQPSEEINSTVPRMKAPYPDNEELDSDDKFIDEQTLDQESLEGERPEALAKFAEVARNDDGKPVRNGIEATEQTAPIPTDPALKQDAATRVLREGVLKQNQGADEAIEKLPDRTAPRNHLPQGQ